MFLKRNVFVSHSSSNKEIAEQFCVFLERIGVDKTKIFCSSIVGQGINNGKKLNDAISYAIQKSKVLIYLLSRDFLNSSYCIEELGIGWYLSQKKKLTCIYLILPDIGLSDVNGFVNSKSDKFSFIDEEHKDDMGLFAENICEYMGICIPKHSILVNAENAFFSAVTVALDDIIRQSEKSAKQQKEKNIEIRQLRETIETQQERIEELRNTLWARRKQSERNDMQIELDTICHRFRYLGFGYGITPAIFNSISKSFWFDMVNRYLELVDQLGSADENMDMLLATIYSANGDAAEAYNHLELYVQKCSSGVYPSFYKNVRIEPENDMQEIIEILQGKILATPKGIVRDSYIETIEHLVLRQKQMEKQSYRET